MIRFALLLAVPFFVACATATDSACADLCDDLTEAELTACETSYDACSIGGVAADVAAPCQDAVLLSYELACDTTEDTDTEDTDAAE